MKHNAKIPISDNENNVLLEKSIRPCPSPLSIRTDDKMTYLEKGVRPCPTPLTIINNQHVMCDNCQNAAGKRPAVGQVDKSKSHQQLNVSESNIQLINEMVYRAYLKGLAKGKLSSAAVRFYSVNCHEQNNECLGENILNVDHGTEFNSLVDETVSKIKYEHKKEKVVVKSFNYLYLPHIFNAVTTSSF